MADLPKMLPGSEPYTSEEWERVRGLLRGACEAEEHFSLDELEAHAARLRGAGVEPDPLAIARALGALRALASEGAAMVRQEACERAAWQAGASPEATQAAIREGAEAFARTYLKG